MSRAGRTGPGRRGRSLGLALLVTWVAAGAGAHEVRPAYLELREREAGQWDVLFKVPARGDRRLGLDLALPARCRETTPTAVLAQGAHVQRWQAICEGGIAGARVAIEGLPLTRTDVLARVLRANGWSQTVRLTPDAHTFVVAGGTAWTSVARTYLGLGVEHILSGFDHLLFVLALVFLVANARRLVGTITSFTLAHSVTLALATLGLVHVPAPPVEAVIALSIVFVAAEVLHGAAGRPGLAARQPWLVAFAFGLLHGLGFAGALRDVGLPQDAVPAALLFFNLGVEAGQLLFVAAVLSVLTAASAGLGTSGARRGPWAVAGYTARPAAYAIGIPSAFWLIERTSGFWG